MKRLTLFFKLFLAFLAFAIRSAISLPSLVRLSTVPSLVFFAFVAINYELSVRLLFFGFSASSVSASCLLPHMFPCQRFHCILHLVFQARNPKTHSNIFVMSDIFFAKSETSSIIFIASSNSDKSFRFRSSSVRKILSKSSSNSNSK